MAPRLELSQILRTMAPHVYFQTTENTTMQYPCIRYEWDDGETDFADNYPYNFTRRYKITVIDRDADSLIPEKVATGLRMCLMDRRYTANDLYHTVFNVFF